MRGKLLVLAVALAALPACAHLSAADSVRTLSRHVPADHAASVRLDFPVGDVDVVAADLPEVSVEVQIRCDHSTRRCADAATKVDLDVSGGERLRVGLSGWPRSGIHGMKVRATLRVPRDTPLAARLEVGRMTVTGVGGGLDANVGVGDVEATLPETSIAAVRATSGIGRASLRTREGERKSRGFLGSSVSWRDGTGKADVRIDCGVGHARVVLQ
jgi:hypothetical protein